MELIYVCASVCVSLFIFCIRTDTQSTSTYMLPQIHIETLRKYAAFNKNGNMHSNSRHKTNEYVKVVAMVVMVMGWEWEWEWKKGMGVSVSVNADIHVNVMLMRCEVIENKTVDYVCGHCLPRND